MKRPLPGRLTDAFVVHTLHKGEIPYEQDNATPYPAGCPGQKTAAGADHSLCGRKSGRKNHAEAGGRRIQGQRVYRDATVSEKDAKYLSSLFDQLPDGKSPNADPPGITIGIRRQGDRLSGPLHLLPGLPADLWYFSPGIPQGSSQNSRMIRPPSFWRAVSFFGVGNDSSILNKKQAIQLFKV